MQKDITEWKETNIINFCTFFSFGSFIFADEYFDRKRDSAISDRDSAEKKTRNGGKFENWICTKKKSFFLVRI